MLKNKKDKQVFNIQTVEMEKYANVFCYSDDGILLFYASVRKDQIDNLLIGLKKLRNLISTVKT